MSSWYGMKSYGPLEGEVDHKENLEGVSVAFAENLKEHRIKKGYSFQKLADAVGVSKAHLWDLETKRATNPSLELLQNLSTTLSVPISALVGENPEESEQNSESVVMYRDLQKLDPEDRETIKLMMERLRKRSTTSED